jgi:hypothetical protein
VATPLRRVVDASPLILLTKAGWLNLLRAGVSEILVPDAVLSEVGARGPTDPVLQQIKSTAWLSFVSTPQTPPSAGLESWRGRALSALDRSDRSRLRSHPR